MYRIVKFFPEFMNKKLYDGIEQGLVSFEFSINADNQKIEIPIQEIRSYKSFNLSDLKREVNNEDFNRVLEEGGFLLREIDSNRYYKYEENLTLEFLQVDCYILVFTFGEKQPSRWVLILEGLWKINQH